MRNETHFKSMCKYIMDSRASKHMISHRAAFNTYEVIASCIVHLGYNSVVKVIGMESIIVETIMNDNINQICIKDALYMLKLHANFVATLARPLNHLANFRF